MNWDENSIIIEYQKITKDSKNSQKNNPKTVTNLNDKEIPKEIPKERYISLEEIQKNIDIQKRSTEIQKRSDI